MQPVLQWHKNGGRPSSGGAPRPRAAPAGRARPLFPIIGCGLLILAAACSAKAGDGLPHLVTHESYVADVTRASSLPVDDLKSVFAFVLGSLPDRVKVYPTENYYYFRFANAGRQYAGNIRLDASDRDEGKVHFAYYEDLAEWKEESPVKHIVLEGKHGVKVEKAGTLAYRISFGAKSVVFELNDLSKVAPPKEILGSDEIYVGPVFDDSAIRFFLVFNSKLKIFHYILDETIPVADTFAFSQLSDRILIGNRTGFAYYRDHRLDRKILIGVFEGNARVNNYYDGPFDQLPDNFLEGDALSRLIVQVDPSLTGKIDRFGGSGDGASRFMIAPYAHYRRDEDLAVFHDCATDKSIAPELYYGCFVIEEQEGPAETAVPDRKSPDKKKKRHKKSASNKGSSR